MYLRAVAYVTLLAAIETNVSAMAAIPIECIITKVEAEDNRTLVVSFKLSNKSDSQVLVCNSVPSVGWMYDGTTLSLLAGHQPRNRSNSYSLLAKSQSIELQTKIKDDSAEMVISAHKAGCSPATLCVEYPVYVLNYCERSKELRTLRYNCRVEYKLRAKHFATAEQTKTESKR